MRSSYLSRRGWLAFQQDLVEATTKWHDGPSILEFIYDVDTGATMNSFRGSILAQMLIGCALLFTIFVLTMQATTVVGMMLNFAALHFLSDLDDLAFRLAKAGFVHDSIEKEKSIAFFRTKYWIAVEPRAESGSALSFGRLSWFYFLVVRT